METKHDPSCDCGICQYCNGSEDRYGNLTNQKLAQTSIFSHGGFFVSTINRPCSAPAAYGARYNETIVWRMDIKTGERGELFAVPEMTHSEVVQELMRTGQLRDESDD
jgi:hypothetical protein